MEHTKSMGKSHEKTIMEAEGLPMGKHRGGSPMKVMEAKHNMKVQKMALAAHERRENGGADPTGKAKM